MTEEVARRRVRRRAEGLSASTEVEGDLDLGSRVASMASPVPLTEGEGVPNRDRVDFTPSGRMAAVEQNSGEYGREYRLKLLHRMLMRNLPLDVIAEQLQCSIRTLSRDRKELNRRLAAEAQNLDINVLIGDTIGFYKEVSGMAMKAASTSQLPMNMRIAAMRTGLSAKNDMHKFLNTSGVYDVLRFRAADNKAGSDIEKLMNITEQLLGSDEVDLTVTDSIEGLEGFGDDDHEVQLI